MAEGSNSFVSKTTEPTLIKTEVITLWSRQRRMCDFFDLEGTKYVGLGKQTAWQDPTNPEINDQNPPVPPIETEDLTELIGVQRIAWQKYAKAVVNPTTEQKEDWNNYIYYKGLYYEVTSDREYALSNGFTCIMMYMLADRDNYWPTNVVFRQVGLYVMSYKTDQYIPAEQWYQLAPMERGHLELVSNRKPLTRSESQSEEFFILLSF